MPDFSKARDALGLLDMMTAPARAFAESVAAAKASGAHPTIGRIITQAERLLDAIDMTAAVDLPLIHQEARWLRVAIKEARKP